MNKSVCSSNHIPCSYLGILGCGGYKNTEQIICMTATGDNNFLTDGIVEGTLLFIDTSSKFKSGLLNVFKYNSDRSPQYKLSKRKVPKSDYIGKVLIAVTQYN